MSTVQPYTTADPPPQHQCPGTGCTATISVSQVACRMHWLKVSKATRVKVSVAYLRGSADYSLMRALAIREMNRA